MSFHPPPRPRGAKVRYGKKYKWSEESSQSKPLGKEQTQLLWTNDFVDIWVSGRKHQRAQHWKLQRALQVMGSCKLHGKLICTEPLKEYWSAPFLVVLKGNTYRPTALKSFKTSSKDPRQTGMFPVRLLVEEQVTLQITMMRITVSSWHYRLRFEILVSCAHARICLKKDLPNNVLMLIQVVSFAACSTTPVSFFIALPLEHQLNYHFAQKHSLPKGSRCIASGHA